MKFSVYGKLRRSRKWSSQCLRKELRTESSFFASYLSFDERVFHVSGISDTKNTHILGTNDPSEIRWYGRNSARISVWCAIHSEGVLDPYFFGIGTIRREYNCQILDTYVHSIVRKWLGNALFQEYSAPQYTNIDA